MGGKGFGGERFGWMVFVKISIFPKLKRFERKTCISLPFPSPLNKQELLPYHFFSLPFPSLPSISFTFFCLQVVIQTSVKVSRYLYFKCHTQQENEEPRTEQIIDNQTLSSVEDV